MDKYLRPLDAPITSDRAQLGYDFNTNSDRGMVQGYSLRGGVVNTNQIADGAVTSAKIAQLTIQTGDIANSAITNVKIASFDWAKGTGGTISAATINADLITSSTINSSILGTPAITGGTMNTGLFSSGTVNNSVLGTPNITGGTVNPLSYKTSGTAGVSGTFSYLTAGTVAGSMVFINGLFLGTL